MDEQPPRRNARTSTIGPNTGPLQELLIAQQAAGAGEVTRLTVIGWEPGRAERINKMSVAFVTIALTTGIGSLRFVSSFVVGIGVAFLAAGTVLAVWQAISRRTGPDTGWEPIGVVLTDRRLLVARESPTGPTLLRDEPAGDISWAAIDQTDRFLLLSGSPRLTLGGDVGPVAIIETPAVSRTELQALAEEAGLRVVQSRRQ